MKLLLIIIVLMVIATPLHQIQILKSYQLLRIF